MGFCGIGKYQTVYSQDKFCNKFQINHIFFISYYSLGFFKFNNLLFLFINQHDIINSFQISLNRIF